jgi:hypothetical protein
MSNKLAAVFVALIVSGSPVLAQGGGGGAGGSGAGAASASSGGTSGGTNQSGSQGNQQTNQNQQANSNQQGVNPAAEKAKTGANTLPASEAPGAVSAPGVGVGHSANGVPIGAPGSGPGSPDHPL